MNSITDLLHSENEYYDNQKVPGFVQGIVVVGAAGANQVHLVVGAGHHVAAARLHQMQLPSG